MKKLIALLIGLLIVPTSLLASECKVTILHFSDLHGYLRTDKGELGGAEGIASIIAKIDTENQLNGVHTLTFFVGDLISGTPVSEQFKGEAEYKFLNELGLEAMVIGNHDFDFGVEAFRKNAKIANFPIFAANVVDKKTGRTLIKDTTVFPLGDECRIGIIGLGTKATLSMSGVDLSDMTIEDPIATAGYYIEDMLEQADVRIALTHQTFAEDQLLAKKVPQFDLIIGGHDHVAPNEFCRKASGIMVCEAPAKGRYIGRIDMTVRDGKAQIDKTELIPVKGGKSKVVRAAIAPYLAQVDNKMGGVIARLPETLYYMPKRGEVTETPLGRDIAKAVKESAKTDVAFQNIGSVRKNLKKGAVTRADIYEALPFGNNIATTTLTGKELIELVKKSNELATVARPHPFLCWAGLEYSGSNGSYAVRVNGKTVDPEKNYTVASSTYILDGKDGYTMLKKIKYKDTGIKVRDVYLKYLTGQK